MFGFPFKIRHMRAFEISLNGKCLCLAGVGNDGVLSTTITHVPFRKRRETRLYIGGIALPQDEHVFWKERILHLGDELRDRKSTRLNSSHGYISYAVFCLKKKKTTNATASSLYRIFS